MKDKFKLSIKENIFLAKKLNVQTIYILAKIEGCNVTFPQTETILNGVSINGVMLEDVEKILNLRNAWKYVLNNIEAPLNLQFMNKINSFVSYNESLDWGVLRYGEIGISGTSYTPKIPIESEVIHDLQQMFKSDKSNTEKAIELMLYCARNQLYWDGNKRTSNIIANKYLISKGCGVLSVPENLLVEYSILLTKFYDTNDMTDIKKFLYENCIHGINLNKDNVSSEELQNIDFTEN